MLRRGVLNRNLNAAMARLGHTDTFAIGDCGLPIPAHVEVIDVSVVFGVPRVPEVLAAILGEVVVEGATVAEEAQASPIGRTMVDLAGVEPEWVSHEELKRRLADCSFVVRTGDDTPYANIILRSGVPF